MRIQHNIMAMNSYRNLSGNNSALSKNLEKLSSGYRINRAGDDAAGLAISEKMRAQIAGLDQAQKNAQSGINMVKTAEGALTEVHDMLNRMTTLATQSANGTYTDKDRDKLQAEVNALIDEIDRIAENSNFNGAKLLNGDLHAAEVTDSTSWNNAATNHNAAVEGSNGVQGKFSFDLSQLKITNNSSNPQDLTFTIGNITATVTGVAAGATADGTAIANAIATACNNQVLETGGATFSAQASGTTVTFEMAAVPTTTAAASVKTAFELQIGNVADTSCNMGQSIAGVDVTQAEAKSAIEYASAKFTPNIQDGSVVQIGDEKYLFAVGKDSQYADGKDGYKLVDLTERETSDSGFAALANAALVEEAKNHENVIVSTDGTQVFITEKTGKIDHETELDTGLQFKPDYIKTGTYAESVGSSNGTAMVLQIGSDSGEKIHVDITSMDSTSLNIKNLDIGSVSAANAAIDTIKAAIEKVSTQRGDLGAIQNRLEHTINNLGVMEENIQDAESTIRDTDVAEEMMAYTKNNILIQSAQAMLAQANQVPQGVLQLMG